MKMPIERACILSRAMVNRTSEGKNSASFSPNADQVRADMIAAIAEAEREKHGG